MLKWINHDGHRTNRTGDNNDARDGIYYSDQRLQFVEPRLFWAKPTERQKISCIKAAKGIYTNALRVFSKDVRLGAYE